MSDNSSSSPSLAPDSSPQQEDPTFLTIPSSSPSSCRPTPSSEKPPLTVNPEIWSPSVRKTAPIRQPRTPTTGSSRFRSGSLEVGGWRAPRTPLMSSETASPPKLPGNAETLRSWFDRSAAKRGSSGSMRSSTLALPPPVAEETDDSYCTADDTSSRLPLHFGRHFAAGLRYKKPSPRFDVFGTHPPTPTSARGTVQAPGHLRSAAQTARAMDQRILREQSAPDPTNHEMEKRLQELENSFRHMPVSWTSNRDPTTTVDGMTQGIQNVNLDAIPIRVFHPMESRLSKMSWDTPRLVGPPLRNITPDSENSSQLDGIPMTHQRIMAGFSPNYKGNICLDRNKSADIPDELNCSLWITDLPRTIDTHQLLAHIRNAGRIYATHINPPEPVKGHSLAAAKVIFFECAAAQRFYARYLAQGFVVAGRRVRMKHNRIKTGEPGEPAFKSRVLLVRGPSAIVNGLALAAYLDTKLEYQVDEVIERDLHDGRTVVEFRFGSFRCQAESAKMAISRELARFGVDVFYAPDPCAPAPVE